MNGQFPNTLVIGPFTYQVFIKNDCLNAEAGEENPDVCTPSVLDMDGNTIHLMLQNDDRMAVEFWLCVIEAVADAQGVKLKNKQIIDLAMGMASLVKLNSLLPDPSASESEVRLISDMPTTPVPTHFTSNFFTVAQMGDAEAVMSPTMRNLLQGESD